MFGPMTFIVVVALVLLTGMAVYGLWCSASGVRPACPKCQTRNRPDARFCAHCGENLE